MFMATCTTAPVRIVTCPSNAIPSASGLDLQLLLKPCRSPGKAIVRHAASCCRSFEEDSQDSAQTDVRIRSLFGRGSGGETILIIVELGLPSCDVGFLTQHLCQRHGFASCITRLAVSAAAHPFEC